MEENLPVPGRKLPSIQKSYGFLLLLISVPVLLHYLFTVLTDGIGRVYIFNDYSLILFGSPLIPLILGFFGYFILKTSRVSNKIINWAAKIGFISLIILIITVIAFLLALGLPGSNEGPALLLFIPPLVFFGAAVIISLVVAAIGLVVLDRKYLGKLLIVLIGSIALYGGLTFLTLPKYDSEAYRMGKNSNDISLCNKMREGSYRFECYQYIAAETNNLSICEKIDNLNFKDKCYRIMGNKMGDLSVCSKIVNSSTRSNCEEEAKTTISIKTAIIQNDYKICNQAPRKNECMWQVGAELGNVDICKMIPADSHSRKSCYRGAAVKRQDQSICDNILNDVYFVQSCKQEVRYPLEGS